MPKSFNKLYFSWLLLEIPILPWAVKIALGLDILVLTKRYLSKTYHESLPTPYKRNIK